MKIAVSLGDVHPARWREVAELADDLGYESLWVPEHLVFPVTMAGSPRAGHDHPPVPSDTPVFDAFAYLAYLAGRTRRIRLGTHVYNIGLRHPFVSARAAATLDIVSDGRFEFGVGASWLREEWDAAGLDFATRGARVDDVLSICGKLWRDPVVEHHSQFFDFEPVAFEPKPLRPIRIHVGGDSPAALRRVVAHGYGWIPMNHSVEQLPAAVKRLSDLCVEAGRAPTIEVTIAGTPRTTDDLQRYADAGVDRLIVRPFERQREVVDGLRSFADEFLAAAAAA